MGGSEKRRGGSFGSYKDSITLGQSLAIQGRTEEFEESHTAESSEEFSEASSRELDDDAGD